MEKIYLEVREAEGGADARLLVERMKSLYEKACNKKEFKCATVD